MAARLCRSSSLAFHCSSPSSSSFLSSVFPTLTTRNNPAAHSSLDYQLICKGSSSPAAPRLEVSIGVLDLWSRCPPWRTHHLRFITQSQKQKKLKKKEKKKKTKRCIIKKLKHLRYAAKVKKAGMNHEEKLQARIERVKLKIDALQKALESYKLPELPAPQHDPESLTEEELHYLKRLGYKHKNYMILGVRGVFGGVVLNMHLHWKKHQLVKIRCKNFTKEEIDETGEQLARLSGGIVVDVQHGSTIVMYRGRNYTRPVEMTPKNTLTKRKALFKAKFEQSLKSMNKNLVDLETELVLYREHKAKQEAGLFPVEPVCGYISSWSDTEGDSDEDSGWGSTDSAVDSGVDEPELQSHSSCVTGKDPVVDSHSDSKSSWDSSDLDVDSDSEESQIRTHSSSRIGQHHADSSDVDSAWGNTDSDTDLDSNESKIRPHSSVEVEKSSQCDLDSDSDSSWGDTDSDIDSFSKQCKPRTTPHHSNYVVNNDPPVNPDSDSDWGYTDSDIDSLSGGGRC